MKDSGVEWIGEIPEEWSIWRTKYFFSVINGSTPKSDNVDYWDGNIVWITPAEMSSTEKLIYSSIRKITIEGLKSCGTTLVPKDSIIISTRAPIGQVCIADVELCTNQGCKSLVLISDKGYSRFYFYYFSIQDAILNVLGRGTTFLELSSFDLRNYPMPFPIYTEQIAITVYLDNKCKMIDRTIAKQQASIEKLKEYKQSIITEAVIKGIDPNVPMKDSGVEWIGNKPVHWQVLRIASLYNEVSESGDDALPIFSVSIHYGVSDTELTDDEMDRIVVRSEDRKKYKKVMPDDLVYNMMRAWQGAFGAVKTEGMVSPAYVVARPKAKLSSRFVEYLLRTSVAMEEIHRYSHGIADFRLRLYWPQFKNIRVSIPSIKEQEGIAGFLDEVSQKVDAAIVKKTQIIEKLDLFKKSLIYEAVTGKLEV